MLIISLIPFVVLQSLQLILKIFNDTLSTARVIEYQMCCEVSHDMYTDINKKFWEELIRLLSLRTSLHAMVAIVTLA
jgi:hypothetical protein